MFCLVHEDGENPDSGFHIAKDGKVKLHCFHTYKSYGMADVYGHHFTAFPLEEIKGQTLALLDARLKIKAGIVARPDVPHDPLPPEANEADALLYEEFRDLLACKWVKFPGEPTTFSYTFGGRWIGMPWAEVGNIWKRLLRFGVVAHGDSLALNGRQAKLYLPGECRPSTTENWKRRSPC